MNTKTKRAAIESTYRVIIKKALSKAVGEREIHPSTPTKDLEGMLKGIVHIAPNVLADVLNLYWERAAKAWERGNNSGNQAGLDAGNEECDRYRIACNWVCHLFEIYVDYPGLYPSFTVRGMNCHDVLIAIKHANHSVAS